MDTFNLKKNNVAKLETSSKKGYRFFEHTADEYVLAYSDNLEEAFENAALVIFDIMTDIETIAPR